LRSSYLRLQCGCFPTDCRAKIVEKQIIAPSTRHTIEHFLDVFAQVGSTSRQLFRKNLAKYVYTGLDDDKSNEKAKPCFKTYVEKNVEKAARRVAAERMESVSASVPERQENQN
jgi:hypothetical protein